MFGFSADKSNGTFKVTKLSDAISIATFGLNVYKLHIDGTIYKETITIKPMRTIAKEVVYNLGEQTIKNEMKLTVDLADMFTALGDDAAIWKNATLDAKTHAEVVKNGMMLQLLQMLLTHTRMLTAQQKAICMLLLNLKSHSMQLRMVKKVRKLR